MLARDFVVIAVIVLFVLFYVYRKQKKKNREAWLRKRGLASKWQKFLEDNVNLYSRLPKQYRKALHGYINVFLDDKQFIGCDDFVITDETRLVIAAQACVLLLGLESDVYPDFHTVMVYPTAYYAEESVSDGLVVTQEKSLRSGESWSRGVVVLSWEEVVDNSRGDSPGHNVVVHEFAHRLDQQNSIAEGVPVLDSRRLYERWASVLGSEFETLQRGVAQGEQSVIDAYGATSPAEFFAVVSELFFELPKVLERHHPKLYRQLWGYYKLDTAAWDKQRAPE